MGTNSANPIIFYDGVCALCNRFVQFVLKRDRADRFRFASLQSDFAAQVLGRHGADPQALDTFYLVQDFERPEERLFARADAAAAVLTELGGTWAAVARVLRLLPRGLRNAGYNLVARYRYRVFGKYDACPLPAPKDRAKFLDI